MRNAGRNVRWILTATLILARKGLIAAAGSCIVRAEGLARSVAIELKR